MANLSRYRDLQNPVLIDPSVPDNGQASAHQALAGAFRDFEGQAGGIADKLQTDVGREQGAAAGAAGKPNPKGPLGGLTPYGQAYNSAAEITYTNQQTIEADSKMDGFEQQFRANPTDYGHTATTYAQSMIDAAPPEYRPKLQLMLGQRIAAGHQRLVEQAFQKDGQEAMNNHLSGQPSRINMALQTASALPGKQGDAVIHQAILDNNREADSLVAAGHMTGAQAAHSKESFAAQLDGGLVDLRIGKRVDDLTGLMHSSVKAADRHFAALMADPSIDDADKASITKKFQQLSEDWHFQQSRTLVDQSVALNQALADGDYGAHIEASARRLYDQGAFTVENLTSAVDHSTRNALDGETEDAAYDRYLEYRAKGVTDPNDKEANKFFDIQFDKSIAKDGIVPGDVRWVNKVLDYSHQSNFIPESAQRFLRIGLLNPETAGAAAGIYQKIKKSSPAVYKYFDDPKIDSYASQIADNMESGMPSAQAQMAAHKSVYEMTPIHKELLETQYKKDVKYDDNKSALIAAIGEHKHFRDPTTGFYGWLQNDVEPSIAMQAEYEGLVRENYTMNDGHLDKARELAAQKVTTLWGMSDVNGTPEVTKYPIQHMHGIPTPVVREDLSGVLNSVGFKGPHENVKIVPNVSTGFTQGKTWSLVHTNEYGEEDHVRDQNNAPVFYNIPAAPDVGKALQAIKAKEHLAAEAKAAAERQRWAADMKERQRIAIDPTTEQPVDPLAESTELH